MEIPEDYQGTMYIAVYRMPSGTYYLTAIESEEGVLRDKEKRRELLGDEEIGFFPLVSSKLLPVLNDHIRTLGPDVERIELSDILCVKTEAAPQTDG